MPFFQGSFSTLSFLLAAIQVLFSDLQIISRSDLQLAQGQKSYVVQKSTENLNFVFHFSCVLS